MASYLAENHILLYTFLSGLLVGNRITGTAVKQSVISSCCAGREIVALKQKGLQATHGTVSGCTRSCSSSADNDYIVFLRHLLI